VSKRPDKRKQQAEQDYAEALNLLSESASQMAAAFYSQLHCDKPREPKLTNAPVADIRDEIRAVYADPASDKPSYRNLPIHVLPRLKARGFTASGRAIQKIGQEAEFEPYRRKQGFKKSTSQAK
jgi:hypothetical protein